MQGGGGGRGRLWVQGVASNTRTQYRNAMEEVAQFLSVRALELRNDEAQADLFGRSAFNRYYYAAYLITRDMLTDFDRNWRSTPHAKIPEILNGSVKKPINNFKRMVTKLGDSESISICSNAISGISELSNVLVSAYSIRVTADYDPDVLIEFGEGVSSFKLRSTSVGVARNWTEQARFLTGVVRRGWNLAHGS